MVLITYRSHAGWMRNTFIAFVLLTCAYVFYALTDPNGPRGGTWPGIAFGSLAYGMMSFAGFLALRKKVRTWPLGKATFWMNGHIWLSFLSIPTVFYHTGFSWGYGLAFVLMMFFTFSILTGVYGLLVQQLVPKWILKNVTQESIFDIIPEIIEKLRAEADALVERICGKIDGPLEPRPTLRILEGPSAELQLVFGAKEDFVFGGAEDLAVHFKDSALPARVFAIEKTGEGYQIRNLQTADLKYPLQIIVNRGEPVTDVQDLHDGDKIRAGRYKFIVEYAPPFGAASLKTFYTTKVRPYFQTDPPGEVLRRFWTEDDVLNCYSHNRKSVPAGTLEDVCDALENLTEERRQLVVQVRLHRIMHNWIAFHAALSIVAIFLGAAHAILALWY